MPRVYRSCCCCIRWGGIDLRLILLAYAGLFTTASFMIALGIWVSTGSTDVSGSNQSMAARLIRPGWH